MNLYDILGVDPSATTADIRKAYRQKAKATHPDAGGNHEDFLMLQTALMVLTDAAKRDRYNRTGQYESDPIDDTQIMPVALLSTMLGALFNENPKMRYNDILPNLTKMLMEMTVNLTAQRTQLKTELERTETFLANLRFEGDGRNLLVAAFERRRENVYSDLADIQLKLDTIGQVNELLSCYDIDIYEEEHVNPNSLTELLFGRRFTE